MHNEYDYIIVGSGPAGIYAAYMTKKMNPAASVVILESESQIGGRTKNTFWNGKLINLGAEHIRMKDKHLIRVIDELKVPKRIEKVDIVSSKSKNWINERIEMINEYTAKNKSLRHTHTAEAIIKEKVLKNDYDEFIKSYGYTDFTKSDLVDSVDHYGFGDFISEGDLFYKIEWDVLLRKMLGNIPVIFGSAVSEILPDETGIRVICANEKSYTGKKLYFAGNIQTAKMIFKNHPKKHLLDNIDYYSFAKVFIKTNMDFFKDLKNNTEIMYTRGPLQRIIRFEKNLYCIYVDSHHTVEILKNLQDYEWYRNQLTRLFQLSDNFKITDIKPVYWNLGTHCFKPLHLNYHDRERFRKDVQEFDKNIYIVGEMISKNQGWVEGAIESYHLLHDYTGYLTSYQFSKTVIESKVKGCETIRHSIRDANGDPHLVIKCQKASSDEKFLNTWMKLQRDVQGMIKIKEHFVADDYRYIICQKTNVHKPMRMVDRNVKIEKSFFNILFAIIIMERNKIQYTLEMENQVIINDEIFVILPIKPTFPNKQHTVSMLYYTLPNLIASYYYGNDLGDISSEFFKGGKIDSLNSFLSVKWLGDLFKKTDLSKLQLTENTFVRDTGIEKRSSVNFKKYNLFPLFLNRSQFSYQEESDHIDVWKDKNHFSATIYKDRIEIYVGNSKDLIDLENVLGD